MNILEYEDNDHYFEQLEMILTELSYKRESRSGESVSYYIPNYLELLQLDMYFKDLGYEVNTTENQVINISRIAPDTDIY